MDAHTLQAAALDALGAHGDARARDLLERADVVLDAAVQTWAASHGTVRGHGVRLRLDARSLGVLHAAPAVADALHGAFARAFAHSPDDALSSLSFDWNGAITTAITTYRGVALRAGRVSLAEAVGEYLDGAGAASDARFARGCELRETGPGEVLVHALPDPWHATALRDAVRALLGEKTAVLFRG